MYADENAIKIKHMYSRSKTCTVSLEKKETILQNQLTYGPAAHFRRCIYKEREIIRQRESGLAKESSNQ